jgi:hypothetical protein
MKHYLLNGMPATDRNAGHQAFALGSNWRAMTATGWKKAAWGASGGTGKIDRLKFKFGTEARTTGGRKSPMPNTVWR